ncbi:MAG: acetyl-CoA acetyltransferase [Hyphomonadaceae bacterium]
MTYILGGWQSDFADNWSRRGWEIADAFAATVGEGLATADLEPTDIETGHVGNFAAELFAGQGLLGGFFALAHPDFNGMPTARHEAACASGSVAILAAAAELDAGRYDLACVVGIEQMRNVSAEQAARHLGSAAWAGHEFVDTPFAWPKAFSDLGDEYERRYGLDYRHLMRISEINFANAKRNPNAQTRKWAFTPDSFAANDETNPIVVGRTRKQDCGQITDGAAIIFLASPKAASAYAAKRNIPLDRLPRIKGWGHRSAAIPADAKLRQSADQPYVFPHVHRAIEDARRRAGAGLDQLDAIETHDCFAMTEYMAIDHLGLTAPGEAWKAIESGDISIGGKLPINPSGGLIGTGHPVGATGVRMVLDAAKQVSGRAGDYQIEGARTVQTLNIGGSATTAVSFVVGV